MSAPAAAPFDILRSLAHELRQPLSTIESIAYYLSLVLPKHEGKVQQQLARLQQLVEQSNWILTSGLQLADPLPVSPVPLDLEELITQALASRPSSVGARPRLELAGHLPPVPLDPALGRALVENLLILFRQFATDEDPLTVRTSVASDGVSLEMQTPARGYRSESSLGPGAGLSLDSARRIVTAHGGRFEFHIDPAGGIRIRVMLR